MFKEDMIKTKRTAFKSAMKRKQNCTNKTTETTRHTYGRTEIKDNQAKFVSKLIIEMCLEEMYKLVCKDVLHTCLNEQFYSEH